MRESFHQPFISNQQEVWLRCANGTLVQLEVVENEKFITQNYKILGQEFVHIQNIMGLIKKNKFKIIIWFFELAELGKQNEIFFSPIRHENVDKVIETKVFFVVLFYVFCSSCTSYPFSFRLV